MKHLTLSQKVEAVKQRCEEVTGVSAKRDSKGWRCSCPSHRGKDHNLLIGAGKNGWVLLTCFSHNCAYEDIARSLGCKVSDLGPPNGRCQGHTDRPLNVRANGSSSSNPNKLAVPPAQKLKATNAQCEYRPIAQYVYHDEDGHPSYVIERYDPKDFVAKNYADDGSLVTGLGDRPRILYKSHELATAFKGTRVHVCEGEKDADRLGEFDWIATTCPFGASAWSSVSNIELLHGQHIIIHQHNDDAGRKHSQAVAESLHADVLSIRIVLPEGLAEHEDVSDWLDKGHTQDELLALIDATLEWEPATITEPSAIESDETQGRRLVVTLASEVKTKETQFLWDGIIPIGSTTLFSGDTGVGKSTVIMRLIATVTRGSRQFFDGRGGASNHSVGGPCCERPRPALTSRRCRSNSCGYPEHQNRAGRRNR